MLIPVGNINDKHKWQAKESVQIQALPTRLTGVQPPPSSPEKEIKGGREGANAWGQFVKGISIQTAKHQENNFKKRFTV